MVAVPRASSRREWPAVMAAGVSLALFGLKAVGFVLTGSSAMLAAAVDSGVDAVMSALNAWTIRAAGTPADAGHPFGHGKIENLSSLVQAALLVAAAISVVAQAFSSVDHSARLEHRGLGLAISVVAIAVAWMVARYLERAGGHHHSPALAADAAHYASDYLVNLGVAVAIIAEWVTGSRIADVAISLFIAAAVLRLAWRTGFDALNALVDGRLAEEELRIIEGVVLTRAPMVHGYHDLLTRRSGPQRFVQMHLELDAALTFRQAHQLVEDVVKDLERAMSNAVVTIHADPWPELPDDGEAPPRVIEPARPSH